jgi:hypothetical protein
MAAPGRHNLSANFADAQQSLRLKIFINADPGRARRAAVQAVASNIPQLLFDA